MNLPIYQVDAFTNKLFGGNYAAVIPVNHWPSDELMSSITKENNLPETAFFIDKGDSFDIRWFTPEIEIDLAGHPTLATAHIIFEEFNYDKEEIIFNSKSGELLVKKYEHGYQMDFPARMPVKINFDLDRIQSAFGIKPTAVYESRDLVVELPNQRSLEAITPRYDLISELHHHAVIVTAPGIECDFVSRFFAPAIGINEDPVTGSAHSTLIPFWANKLGKNKLEAIQVSQRIGILHCEMHGDRVKIGGNAITYLKGEIFV